MTLQRLVITFDAGEITTRVLYRRRGEGPSPGTVSRRREVVELARTGLQRALAALDAGDVADLGTSGFTTREDVLGLATASSDSQRPMRKGA